MIGSILIGGENKLQREILQSAFLFYNQNSVQEPGRPWIRAPNHPPGSKVNGVRIGLEGIRFISYVAKVFSEKKESKTRLGPA